MSDGRELPASWRGHDDRPRTDVPPVPGPSEPAFYLPIGALQGADYARNAFARGTAEEYAALAALLDLVPGTRLLDVGCGDGRHLRAAAAHGVVGTGVEVAPELAVAARQAATRDELDVEVLVGDARRLDAVLGARAGSFDVAWSLCQGALGTSPVSDPDVVAGMAHAVRPGGTVVVTCFHALFAARHLAPGDAFDTVSLVHHQRSEVHGSDHRREHVDLWTSAYTVREAVRLVTDAGLEPVTVRGVEPGAYARRPDGEVALDDPEILVVARRPG